MELSVELFLLDNIVMNFLMLRLGSVFAGVRPKSVFVWLAAGGAAIYALLSVAVWPVLTAFVPKLLLGAVMALPLTETPRKYGKALGCLYLSACLMGGAVFGLTMLVGGSFRSGMVVTTVPIRIALLAAFVCAMMPRLIQSVLRVIRGRMLRVPIRIRLEDRTLELTALVDSGNLLCEPMSGLPVIIVQKGLLPKQEGWPVPFATVNGTGVLNAIRPKEIVILQGYAHRVRAMAAEATGYIRAADAIIGSELLSEERWCVHGETETDAGETVQKDHCETGNGDPVYPFGRDPSAALLPDRGTGVD